MSQRVTLMRGAAGRLRAIAAKKSDRVLARLLESDLQEDRETTLRLLHLLQDPAATDAEFIGNAHSVQRKADTVRVSALFDSDTRARTLSREECAALVASWLELIG